MVDSCVAVTSFFLFAPITIHCNAIKNVDHLFECGIV